MLYKKKKKRTRADFSWQEKKQHTKKRNISTTVCCLHQSKKDT
jgi:hypothetical protein